MSEFEPQAAPEPSQPTDQPVHLEPARTLDEAIARAEALAGPDPQAQLAYRAAAVGAFGRREQAGVDRDAAAFEAVAPYLHDPRVTSPAQIPPEVWDGLSEPQRTSVYASYARPEKTSDPAVYTGLAAQYARDPAGFARTDPLSYVTALSPGDFEQVAGWRSKAMQGGGRPSEDQLVLARLLDVARAPFTAAGYGAEPRPGSPQAHDIARFQRQLMDAAEDHRIRTGKAPDDDTIQSLADRLLIEGLAPGGLLDHDARPVPGGGVPAEAHARISRDFLARHGRPPAPGEVEDLYGQLWGAGLLR